MLKIVLKTFTFIIICLSLIQLNAQDDMKMMHYNLLFYGNPFACDESNNNTNEKDDNLQIILEYAQPDILTVNELSSEEFYADRILDQVLNIGVIPNWSRAVSTNTSWDSGIVNMLYYQHGKYTLHDQQVANQSPSGTNLIRVVDMYTLYENSSAISGDTIFFNILVAHLAASDEDMRLKQCEAAMAMIENNGPGNYIFSGDFNIDSSNAEEFQKLINYDSPEFSFYDPANALGTWHNNPSFAAVHSQSTRINGGGCHSGGGMDDRFDFTLLTDDIMNGTHGLSYVFDSYRVLGNDGENYDQSLHISNNEDVPANVAIALYTVSDHLPILTSYDFDENVGIIDQLNNSEFNILLHENNLELSFKNTDKYLVRILNFHGQLIAEKKVFKRQTLFDLSNLSSALYVVSAVNLSNGNSSNHTFIYNK